MEPRNKPLKIVFITPQGRKEEDSHHRPIFSMSIGTLVTITPKHHHIELVDEIWGDLIDYGGDYDLVGITVRSLNAHRSYDIADEFMRRGTTVILGGPHPSLNYDEAIEHCSSVVCGEAENLWETVLQDLSRGTLKSRYNAGDFPPVDNPPGLDYERLFTLSKRDRVDVRKPIPIFLSRGCPYECSFCCTPELTDKQYRIQTPQAVVAQIEAARRTWFRETSHEKRPWFQFCDDNIAINKEKTWEILTALKECNILFSTYCSINLLEDPRTVRLLVDAGCMMVLVGFESLNPRAQQYYGKESVNIIDKFKRIIRQCRKAGLCIQANFVVNPAIDTPEDMDAILRFVRESRVVMPAFTIITPFPGTKLFKEYKEKKLIVDEEWDNYTCQNLVVRAEHQDPEQFHLYFVKTYCGMYTWPNIILRVLSNPYKFLTFYTSLRFRQWCRDYYEHLRAGTWEHELPQNVRQNMPRKSLEAYICSQQQDAGLVQDFRQQVLVAKNRPVPKDKKHVPDRGTGKTDDLKSRDKPLLQ